MEPFQALRRKLEDSYLFRLDHGYSLFYFCGCYFYRILSGNPLVELLGICKKGLVLSLADVFHNYLYLFPDVLIEPAAILNLLEYVLEAGLVGADNSHLSLRPFLYWRQWRKISFRSPGIPCLYGKPGRAPSFLPPPIPRGSAKRRPGGLSP